MAYPTTLDTFTAVPTATGIDFSGIALATRLNLLQPAIEALEAKVGVTSSAVTTTHEYKLANPLAGHTLGRVVFVGASNAFSTKAALFWDNTNDRLSINAGASPTARLQILETSTTPTATCIMQGKSDGGSGTRAVLEIREDSGSKNMVTLGSDNATPYAGMVNLSGFATSSFNLYSFGDFNWFNRSGEALGNADLRVGILRIYRDGAANKTTFQLYVRNGTPLIAPFMCMYDGRSAIGSLAYGAQLTHMFEVKSSVTTYKTIVGIAAASQTVSLFELQTSGLVALFAVSAVGDVVITPSVGTSGSRTAWRLTAPAHTNQTAGADIPDVDFAINRTVQGATGAMATQRAIIMRQPTYSFVGSSTITTAATLAIVGAPVAGTNATITNSHALWVQAGISKFDGAVSMASTLLVTGATTISNILTVNNLIIARTDVTHGSIVLDFNATGVYFSTIEGAASYTTTNRGVNKQLTLIILGDTATDRALTFPGWVWVPSGPPTDAIATKIIIIRLYCQGSTEASVIAQIEIEA